MRNIAAKTQGMYWDHFRNCAARLLADGTVEHSSVKHGDDGFMHGVFADGARFVSEVPVVAFLAAQSNAEQAAL
jgi:hypothetical protein